MWLRKNFLSRRLLEKIIVSSRGANSGKMKTMKMDKKKEFLALFTPELNSLATLFNNNNYQLRIAGGAVRDLLMDVVPADVDFASTATPEQMKVMFDKENIRMLHKRGEEHGTITCRINDKENFEITTLRIDVICDGRRAEVKFTTDWQLDASRRDLTINSLFLDLDGTVYDYFGGIEDVHNRRVVFVGDVVQRIQEDYLRILRYFRFFGRIAKTPDEHDDATLDAITNNSAGLDNVSGERLWVELKKIVVGRFGSSLMEIMCDRCRLAPYLGLPQPADCSKFTEVYRQCIDCSPQPMTLITSLLNSEEDIKRFHLKNKLSNQEMRLAEFIQANRDNAAAATDLKFFQDLLLDEESAFAGSKQPNGRDRLYELLKYVGKKELIKVMEEWTPPQFPINGVILVEAGMPKGPGIRRELMHLFDIWKASSYAATKEELLSRVGEAPSREPPASERKRRKLASNGVKSGTT